MIYPVGSIYLSVNNVDPSTLFGGTWERIEGKFLLASSSTHAIGTIGGEESHTLTQGELPHLTGYAQAGNYWASSNTEVTANGQNGILTLTGVNEEYTSPTGWANNVAARRPGNLGISFGNDEPHNNMPPYLTVNIWKRIS